MDRALLAGLRRQQELLWTEGLVEHFGRTVNLAARIAARAGPGQVLVSQRVAESAAPEEVCFVAWGEPWLKGFAHPVRLLEARRAR
jgi:adenylate cyclase